MPREHYNNLKVEKDEIFYRYSKFRRDQRSSRHGYFRWCYHKPIFNG
ncbi:hypothetical protein MARI151_10083 [Maribacter litoralis]|uniref:Uncharacterized protein n=1 Tax=Maribacter litoralis TaxID=2059726 RepID=A0A653LN04_9FLAO|nr:hypothetical protein MARI151_10083 [Maribacter litoralis]